VAVEAEVPRRQEGRVAADAVPREPEKLRLPAGAVQYLLLLALRTELGSAWWNGFVTAHGEPSWLAPGRWRVVVPDATLLPGGEEG
jgi:hypothetical protein